MTELESFSCDRPGCGHPMREHEEDERFSHGAGACGFGMSAGNPEGDCEAECMGFVLPGGGDELPAILAAQDAA